MQEVLASNADVLLESGMPSSELFMLILHSTGRVHGLGMAAWGGTRARRISRWTPRSWIDMNGQPWTEGSAPLRSELLQA